MTKRLFSILATTAFLLSAALIGPKTAAAESALLMFESPGCGYCEAWKAQVGPIYPKTEEAKRLPLSILNIHNDLPEQIEFKAMVQFSPTFVVVEDGKEVGRIVGYQGDEFFWWYLDALHKKLKPLNDSDAGNADAGVASPQPDEG